MTASEFSPRSGFEILFEGARFAFGSEGDRSFNAPRSLFACMCATALIMHYQSSRKVTRKAAVMNCFIDFADENVDVEKVLHGLACQAVVFGAQKES